MWLGHDVAREPEFGVHPAAQREGLRRRRHPVNGQAEGRKDGARLSERHGAAARGLQQRRSVEAAEHDAEASVDRHLAEHLRRWQAGGEDGLGHPRLLLAELRRETFPEQFYDLTWRPGVDVRRAALVDLLPEGSPHRPSSRRSRPNTDGGQKRRLPRSWLPVMSVACPGPQHLPKSRRNARFETSPVLSRHTALPHELGRYRSNADVVTRHMTPPGL